MKQRAPGLPLGPNHVDGRSHDHLKMKIAILFDTLWKPSRPLLRRRFLYKKFKLLLKTEQSQAPTYVHLSASQVLALLTELSYL